MQREKWLKKGLNQNPNWREILEATGKNKFHQVKVDLSTVNHIYIIFWDINQIGIAPSFLADHLLVWGKVSSIVISFSKF